MRSLPTSIFSQIEPDQRLPLLKNLVLQKVVFHCKCVGSDDLYTLKPTKVDLERYLICEKQAETIPVTGTEKVIICFNINSDKYFIQSSITPSVNGQTWNIDGQNDIFKLQRRQHYRVNIPPAYKSKAVFRDPKSDSKICTGVISDISSGGCKVLLDKPSLLKVDETPFIDIYIGRRDAITLTAEIRSVRSVTDPLGQQALGIMFKSVSSLTESKIFAITMELHRELVGKVGIS